jgi:hypothetical protein
VPGTGSSGRFFEDLKSLFKGSTGDGDLNGDFTGLGLSDDEARYYSDNRKSLTTILIPAAAQ